MKNFKVGRYDYGSYVNMACYAICSLLVPTSLYCIARDLDFPLEEGGKGLGGMLQMGRSVPMVFAMIFCTFAAGKLGKAKTLGYSMVLMG